MDRIVVVGTSLAGLRCIEALRREGFAGEIVAVGEEPDAPYDRPPLSKQFLKGEWDADQLALRREGLADLHADWRLCVRASGLDTTARRVHLGEGESLVWDGLVIATGTVPRRLPFGEGLAGVHLLRTLADARALRADLEGARHVVVVGGGFIGMEVAASCRERGLEVTVVEPLEQPLLRGLGPELGAFMAEQHRARGVDVRCGVAVEGFVEGEGRVRGVRLGDGATLEADCVVVGIGVVPATDWLEGSGLVLDDGVVCDAKGATAVEGVVACGDVARWAHPRWPEPRRLEHWTSAVEQAGVAARRLVKGDADTEPLEQVPYVWTDQYELRIAIAGEVVSGGEQAIGHGTLEEGRCLVLFGKDGALRGAVGFKRPRPLMAARRALRAGMSWDEAVATLL